MEAMQFLWQKAIDKSIPGVGIPEKVWATMEHILSDMDLDDQAKLFLKATLKASRVLKERTPKQPTGGETPIASQRRKSTGGSPRKTSASPRKSSASPRKALTPAQKEKEIDCIQ